MREFRRKVGDDYRVEVDTNRYSVPFVHIGRWLLVRVEGDELKVVRVQKGGVEEVLAQHVVNRGRNQDVVEPAHGAGLVRRAVEADEIEPETDPLARPLSVYDAAVGGAL
jgi:hypothetical protein